MTSRSRKSLGSPGSCASSTSGLTSSSTASSRSGPPRPGAMGCGRKTRRRRRRGAERLTDVREGGRQALALMLAPGLTGLRRTFPPGAEDRVQTGRLSVGPLVQTLLGNAYRDEPVRERVCVAFSVRLKRPPLGVELVAIKLDDHPLGFEDGVDLV